LSNAHLLSLISALFCKLVHVFTILAKAENVILGRHILTLSESSSGPLGYRSKVNNV